jgi:capsular exopolysaccharide synthesis family protein
MDFAKYLKMALRWWWLALLCIGLSVTASYFYTQRQPKIYAAKATLSVGNSIVDSLNPDEQIISLSETLGLIYGELARRKVITQAVIDKLGLDMDPDTLSEMIGTGIVPSAQLLEITVLDVHPQRAQLLANAIAEELIAQTPGASVEQQKREDFINNQLADLEAKIQQADQRIQEQEELLGSLTSAVEIAEAQSKLAELEKLKGDYQNSYIQFLGNRSDVSPNRLAMFEPAVEPTWPVGPDVKKNVAIAGAAGLALAMVAILLIEFFNDILVWRHDTAQAVLGMPVLGAVGKKADMASVLVAQDTLWSPEADALRNLRNSIFLAVGERPLSTFLVTSASPGEGKSFLAANLAATIAAPGTSAGAVIATPGSRVILVDADLRKPTQHEIFDMPNLLGLADVLAMPEAAIETMLKKALRPTSAEGMLLLPAGRTPVDPGALLNSPRFVQVLQLLSTRADLVIIDSAPILEAIETKAMANVVDGVLLVVSDGQSRGKIVQKAVDYFKNKPTSNLLGLVFNRVKLARQYDYYATHTYQQKMRQSQRAEQKPGLFKQMWSFGKTQPEDSETLTLAEVADQLGVSQDMARRWCEEGRLPAVKIGRHWEVQLEDLNEFILVYQTEQVDEKSKEELVSSIAAQSQNNGRVEQKDQPEIEEIAR